MGNFSLCACSIKLAFFRIGRKIAKIRTEGNGQYQQRVAALENLWNKKSVILVSRSSRVHYCIEKIPPIIAARWLAYCFVFGRSRV
jgi:hypothetical protein